MALPVKIKKIYKTLKQFEEQRRITTLIAVVGPNKSGKTTLIKEFNSKDVFVETNYASINDSFDLVLVVLSGNKNLASELGRFLQRLRKKQIPFIIAINKIDKSKNLEQLLLALENRLKVEMAKVVPLSVKNGLGFEDLKRKILASLPGHHLSLAHKVPSFRELVANKVIRATSGQNALYAGITIIPGTDMPVLTANQAKMILELAAIYGEELSFTRAKELLATIGGGYLFRGVARQLLDFLPGPGWLIKASVAYSGTQAMGKAAKLYFGDGSNSDNR